MKHESDHCSAITPTQHLVTSRFSVPLLCYNNHTAFWAGCSSWAATCSCSKPCITWVLPAVLKTMSKGQATHNFYPHDKANSSGSQLHISPFEGGSKSSFQVHNLLFCCCCFFPYESDSLHSLSDRCFCCVIQLTMDIMYFISRCWVLHFLRAATICLWLEVWLFK